MERADFNTVKALIHMFVEQDHIKNRLDMIYTNKISDWEKWLQLELEFYISHHDSITEIEREVRYPCDRRKNKTNINMFIDLKIRRKRCKKNSYIFIELKCAKSACSLLSKMESDISKVLSIKQSADVSRSFWCVGFYTKPNQSDKNKVQNQLNEYVYRHHGTIHIPSGEIGVIII
ncbi:TPA: hypothetical protein I8W52_003960 [Morganella morganii]|nr:hypothetical protein [Morganella morganii]